MSEFKPNTPIKLLIDNQMVERWRDQTNFGGYYSSCAPSKCTYTVVRYNSFAYMISLLIGLYGGLTVALRFMVPFIVKFGRRIYEYIKTRKQVRTQAQQGIN